MRHRLKIDGGEGGGGEGREREREEGVVNLCFNVQHFNYEAATEEEIV